MAAEQVTEQIAEHLEEAAEVTRRLNISNVGFFVGGLGVGIAVGFYFGYRWNRAKIRAEVFKKSEEEVAEIREVYRQKTLAAEPKPAVEEVVKEKGYSVPGPVTLPSIRPTRPSVPVQEPLAREILRKESSDGWDFAKEVAQRSDDRPYILHQDEFRNSDTGFKQVVYTWYDRDNVLTDEDEDPIANPDDIVGMENLTKFGHGADDVRALFVRNVTMRTEFEICFVDASFEEEVEGLSNESTDQ